MLASGILARRGCQVAPLHRLKLALALVVLPPPHFNLPVRVGQHTDAVRGVVLELALVHLAVGVVVLS